MTVYLVDVHHVTHTCPLDANPHRYDTRRTLVAVIAGGPCRSPATIRLGHTNTIVTVDCGRQLPAADQCDACRKVVQVRNVTTEHAGYHGITDRELSKAGQRAG